MKVLVIDNNPANRSLMSQLLQEQGIITVDGLLEAPNRIMGAMLLEAIEFNLVIIGGGLNNTLPDGSEDSGNGLSLIAQLLEVNPSANVVLWSDKAELQIQFRALLTKYKNVAAPYFCWKKTLTLQEMETHLLQIYQQPWEYRSDIFANECVLY